MSDPSAPRTIPPLPALIQAAVTATGIILWMTVGKEWILLAGIGAFVPGILRELGVMRDLDEFQRGASRRAAFHAYLVGGLATACIVTGLHLGGGAVDHPAEMVTLILVILWMVWLFSYLHAFWGPQRTASTVLLAFGAFWLLFAVLDGASEPGTPGEKAVGILVHLVFVAPFAIGAFAAMRWPRPTGWLLVVTGVAMVYFIGKPSPMSWTTQLLTLTLLGVPVLASGVGLVRMTPEDGDTD